MGSTLNFISKKFDLDLHQKSPITILKINRGIMADTLCELGYKVGAEVGVCKGDHAELLFQRIPGLKLYGIDVWESYPGYHEYQTSIGKYHEAAISRLSKYDSVLIQKYSMDAVKDFRDGSLDFVYIDAAHDFKSVAEDIYDWTPKVRPGGIVYGHDYKRQSNPKVLHHVKDVVSAYCYALQVHPWFILGDTGKSDDLYREGTRSWMFVRGEHAD